MRRRQSTHRFWARFKANDADKRVPVFLLAILFIVVNVVVNVVSQFWKAITTFLPCINALPCFREEADYEGVPTFEDAFMMDKLIGAHTYEMRR